jgi:hypothetical protein
MPQGTICVINPGQLHEGRPATEAEWEYRMVYMPTTGLINLLKDEAVVSLRSGLSSALADTASVASNSRIRSTYRYARQAHMTILKGGERPWRSAVLYKLDRMTMLGLSGPSRVDKNCAFRAKLGRASAMRGRARDRCERNQAVPFGTSSKSPPRLAIELVAAKSSQKGDPYFHHAYCRGHAATRIVDC